MRGLLYKDFILICPPLKLVLLGILQSLFLIPYLSTISMGNQAFVTILAGSTMFLCASVFSTDHFSPDEKYASLSFGISTPWGAKGMMQSKYYAMLIINVIQLFISCILDMIFSIFSGTNCCWALFFLFGVNLLIIAIKTPFIVRYGSAIGTAVMPFLFMILLIIIGIYFLFGDISFLFADNPLEALKALLAGKNLPLILALFPCVTIIFYYISYRLSLALYRKGIETYRE